MKSHLVLNKVWLLLFSQRLSISNCLLFSYSLAFFAFFAFSIFPGPVSMRFFACLTFGSFSKLNFLPRTMAKIARLFQMDETLHVHTFSRCFPFRLFLFWRFRVELLLLLQVAFPLTFSELKDKDVGRFSFQQTKEYQHSNLRFLCAFILCCTASKRTERGSKRKVWAWEMPSFQTLALLRAMFILKLSKYDSQLLLGNRWHCKDSKIETAYKNETPFALFNAFFKLKVQLTIWEKKEKCSFSLQATTSIWMTITERLIL